MIIIFDKTSGDLVRFVTGTCINPDTFEIDGYLNVLPGGQYDNPPVGQGVFNLDENTDPVLGNDVAKSIYYGESGRYYISDIGGVLSLVESV